MEPPLEKVKELYTASQFNECQQLLEELLKVSPENPIALTYLSKVIQKLTPGSPQPLQLLKKAVSVSPPELFTLFTLGSYYFHKNLYKPAKKYFMETLKLDPNHFKAAFNLGVCFDNSGDFNTSLQYYSVAVKIDSGNPKALTNKGITLDKLGKSEEARICYESALKIEESAKTYNNLGLCLRKLGDSENAMRCYEKACLLDPGYSMSHLNFAFQLSEVNELEKAADHYKIALKLESANVFVCLGTANALETQQKFESALMIYKSILEIMPDIIGVKEKHDKILLILEKLRNEQKFKLLEVGKGKDFFQWEENFCYEVLDVDNNSLEAHLRLGVILSETRRFAEARPHLYKTLELDKKFYPYIVYSKLGEVCFSFEKDFEKARKLFLLSVEIVPKPETWIRCGDCWEKLKKFELASEDYQKALDLDSRYALAYLKIGWALFCSHKKEFALEMLEKALALDPESQNILMIYGKLLLRMGHDIPKATIALEKAFQLNKTSHENALGLAKAYEKSSRPSDALKLYEYCLDLPNISLSAIYRLGIHHMQQKSYEKAISFFKRCLKSNKVRTKVPLHLAICLANCGEIEEATHYFNYTLKLEPNNPTAHFNLGKILQESGGSDEAEVHYLAVLAEDKQHYKAHCQLGILFMQRGRNEEAFEHLEMSILINPEYIVARLSIGMLLYDTGNAKESLKHFKVVLKINQKEVQALIGIGNAYFSIERRLKAMKYYQRALEIDSSLPEIHYNLGNAYYENNDIEKAISSYKKTVEITPRKADAHYNLGNALCLVSNYSEAVTEYKIAIELNKKNAQSYYNLGVALSSMNDNNAAISAFQEALKINPGMSEANLAMEAAYAANRLAN